MKMNQRSNKKWFSWHLLPEPKDIPIQSVYEVICLIALLGVCLFVYLKMNHVNVVHCELGIACLKNQYYEKDYSVKDSDVIEEKSFAPYANITFYQPMTRHDDLLKTYIEGATSPLEGNGDIFVIFGGKTLGRFQHPKYLESRFNWSQECNKVRNKMDSIITMEYPSEQRTPQFFIHHSINIRDNMLYSYTGGKKEELITLCTQSYDTILHWKKFYEDKESNSLHSERVLSGRIFRGMKYFTVGIVPMAKSLFGEHNLFMGRPSMIALEDISQQYYDIKLDYFLLDSVDLTFQFVGATEFSDMIPEPDVMTMSSISFTDQRKIRQINQNGLRFHVRFKELENRQNVRLFFLTSTMSALLTILIVFVILGIYKFCKHMKEYRQENNSETNNNL